MNTTLLLSLLLGMSAALVASHYAIVVFWPGSTRAQIFCRYVTGVAIVMLAWSIFAIDASSGNLTIVLVAWLFFAVGGLATLIPHAIDRDREKAAKLRIYEQQNKRVE